MREKRIDSGVSHRERTSPVKNIGINPLCKKLVNKILAPPAAIRSIRLPFRRNNLLPGWRARSGPTVNRTGSPEGFSGCGQGAMPRFPSPFNRKTFLISKAWEDVNDIEPYSPPRYSCPGKSLGQMSILQKKWCDGSFQGDKNCSLHAV